MVSSAEHKAGMRRLSFELRHKGHTRVAIEKKQRDEGTRMRNEGLLKEQAAYEARHSLPKIQIVVGQVDYDRERPDLRTRTIYTNTEKIEQEFKDGSLISERSFPL